MNAIEIEQAITQLAAQPFDAAEFPYAFLEAFGNKATTIKRLRTGDSNASDVAGGVLQRYNIHLAVCAQDKLAETLAALKSSPKTVKGRVKFVLATDGEWLEAEEMGTGETIACEYADFANHFGFFLPLAGISTVKQIRNNPIDIQATSRLNRLYVELLKDNPEWGTEARRHEMNQLMARLIFCFFAEDTEIFSRKLFSSTFAQMSDHRSDTTQEVLAALFRAMDTPPLERAAAGLPRWAAAFPYVNGGLFAGAKAVPRFSRVARSYLLHAGNLNWQAINPDIFGSMIQAVAEADERGALGLHYTSVPNILKVLNPLFLDGLRAQLAAAGSSRRKLLSLRRRLARVRVFDPACGSGNFLVIAYIQLREIEAEVVRRLGEVNESGFVSGRSWLRLESFFGIELKDFAVEVARLSLLVAEFQCDVRFLGEREAVRGVLPLRASGQVVCGNALRLDWLAVCPPVRPGDGFRADLFEAVPDFVGEVDAEAETFVCGNPPYLGSTWQSKAQKEDLKGVFDQRTKSWKSLDYVAGWFMKAADYGQVTGAAAAFVSTNSICQGQQVNILWPLIFEKNHLISFAYKSFKWKNLAAKNAGVTVSIVCISASPMNPRKIFELGKNKSILVHDCENINQYLIDAKTIFIEGSKNFHGNIAPMVFGNMPRDNGHLLMNIAEYIKLTQENGEYSKFLKYFVGSEDFIHGKRRACIWVSEAEQEAAQQLPELQKRFELVATERKKMKAISTQAFANRPYRFVQIQGVAQDYALIIPRHSSEVRKYLPVGVVKSDTIVADSALALYDAPLWNMALIASRLHLVWIATVCGKLKTDFRYSNTLGWNTFPVPFLTQNNKDDLTRCAEHILLAREQHFPATIADLYAPDTMPDNLRQAHDQNDETLERIYIGRRFKNDTERLEKLFALYTQMTAEKTA